MATPSPTRQAERLDQRVQGLLAAFAAGAVTVDEALPADDPELVVVFEVVDSQRDVTGIAARLGIEILVEAEDEAPPDDDFPRIRPDGSTTGSAAPVGTCLHALCATRQAATELVALWQRWLSDGRLTAPYGGLADLFAHLRDVRPWGPADRLRMQGAAERLAGMLEEQQVQIEVELWFRRSAAARVGAQQRVADLTVSAGGAVLGAAVLPEIGYHGLAVELPVPALRALVAGDYDGIALVKAPDVLYLRATGQVAVDRPTDVLPDSPAQGPLPTGDPVVCLLDGVPVTNHDRLTGRLTVSDPDDLSGLPLSTVTNRRHGTAMASVLIWGDLSGGGLPAARPILVRPIIAPAAATNPPVEEFPPGLLAPDLMWRVFRELFEGVGDQPPVGSSVVIINLSIGDPAMPFDVLPSAWARAVDWLSFHYGVLVVVSAGNHRTLPVKGMSGAALAALAGEDRRGAVRAAMAEDAGSRRLLSPAESLNALTIGAIHQDAAGDVAAGYRFDPGDGSPMIHPLSALGRGQRRAVKPDLVTSGGRSYLTTGPGQDTTVLSPAPSPVGPGVRVAAASTGRPTNGLGFVTGTSPAAALVSRRGAELHDLLSSLEGWPALTERRQRAVAIKALLAHGAVWPDLLADPIAADRVWGYGTLERDLLLGCADNEATVVFLGQLRADQEQRMVIPLPAGLQQVGTKRVTATMAWLSPINSVHRQYRSAKLSFAKPLGLVPVQDLKPQTVDGRASQRGTLQQQSYETRRASTAGRGAPLSLDVKCAERAGGLLGADVDYAVAVSLWVAPELGIDVYQQVREELRASIRVQPPPA